MGHDNDAMYMAYYRAGLAQYKKPTRETIRSIVEEAPFPIDDATKGRHVRELEASYDITQDIGATVRTDHTPWLSARKKEIDFFYWDRLKSLHLRDDMKGSLPPLVVSTLDDVTDEILDYCGNPADQNGWKRRGMVIGHVQSGKTTNYAALVCKAADAGYKVIILLAGITNTLRTQTQERLDQSFIGKKSVFQTLGDENLPILDLSPIRRFPAYGTSRDRDFAKQTADTYGVSLDSLNEPIIFVTKKNKSTLSNLAAWLEDQKHGHALPGPLLLIDDEADNASINTAKDAKKITAINEQIRAILAQFRRSTYIGYTATPFANIFIHPDSQDEMLKDDLFPSHFIKALDPPSNYVGASRIFDEDGDMVGMVRTVDDHEDLLPLKHKKELDLADLPQSLKHAIRLFILSRAIRILRGDGNQHASMMINVSRFNDVQDEIRGQVYRYNETLRQSIVVNAGLGSSAQKDPLIQQLSDDFRAEYSDTGFAFAEVLKVLRDAIASVRVETVNMKGGKLDYSRNEETGLHIIAIGGFALSRGLTLEGLTISYILRNASASDTLLQMARWFGYRPGYEDLCRLFLPESSVEHYEYITEATEELRSEVRRMELLGMTPEKFGLRVRQSPTAIRVTAANKMRNASKIVFAADYAGRHIEGYALENSERTNQKHLKLVADFISGLPDSPEPTDRPLIWHGVAGKQVFDLLANFKFPAVHTDLAAIQGDRSVLMDYIEDRLNADLKTWDVAIPHLGPAMHGKGHSIAGSNQKLRTRNKAIVKNSSVYLTSKNKAADPQDHEIGLSAAQKMAARAKNIPGPLPYGLARSRPLLLIHYLQLPPADNHRKIGGTVVTLSFCLTASQIDPEERTYQVGQVYLDQMNATNRVEIDDDETLIEATTGE